MIHQQLELLIKELKAKKIIAKNFIDLEAYDRFINGFEHMVTLHDIANYRPTHINDVCKDFYGFKNNFLKGMDYIYYIKTIHPSYYPTLFRSLTFFNDNQEEFLDLTYKLKAADGSWHIFVGTTKTVSRTPDGKPMQALSLLLPESTIAPTNNSTLLLMERLTKRETEVLLKLAEGKKVRLIAQDLFIAEETVKKHKKNIFKKLNCNKTSELVKLVFENGIKF
ncbi:hypothetical protein GCM10028791_00060 [Echinicola sediminis]